MPTWFLIIALIVTVVAIIAYLVWRYRPALTDTDFIYGSTPFEQKRRDKKLRDKLLGRDEPAPFMAKEPLSGPVWLEPEPKQGRRNRRFQQTWRYRHGVFATALVFALLSASAWYLWFLPVTVQDAGAFLLAINFIGVALILYGGTVLSWNKLRLKAESSRLRLGLDQDGLLLATPEGSIERQPIDTLAFDGRWLSAGSYLFDLTRPATRRERLAVWLQSYAALRSQPVSALSATTAQWQHDGSAQQSSQTT